MYLHIIDVRYQETYKAMRNEVVRDSILVHLNSCNSIGVADYGGPPPAL